MINKKFIKIFLIIFMLSFSLNTNAYEIKDGWNSVIKYNSMQFRPADNYKTMQNPPGFCWPYVDDATYDLIVTEDENLRNIIYKAENLKVNSYLFPYAFKEGEIYYWSVRYKYKNGNYSSWHKAMRFLIEKDASKVSFSLPEDYKEYVSHPMFLDESIIKNVDKNSSAFKELYNRVEYDMLKPLPKVDVNADDRVKEGYYQLAERTVRASLLYRITNKERYKNFALSEFRNLFPIDFKTFLTWNANNDRTECIFSYNAAITYDLLYYDLSEEERAKAVSLIERNIERPFLKFQNNGNPKGSLYERPFGSHEYRIYEAMGASLIIADRSQLAKEILDFTLPFYVSYRHCTGVEDGSTINGPFYGISNEHDEIARMFQNVGLVNEKIRPFNCNSLYNLLYLWNDNWVNMIGDCYRDKPKDVYQHKLKTQFDALNSDNRYMSSVNKWLFKKTNGENDTYFFGRSPGSIDTRIKDVKSIPPYALPDSKYFYDTGRTAMYSDMVDSGRIGLMFISNPYGSFNHAHPDQNSFIIEGFGEELLIDSDYYDSYHSPFDMNWNKKTYAHNTITFDNGISQNQDSIHAKGKITSFINHSSFDLTGGEAKDAYYYYEGNNRINYLDKFERNIIYLKPDVFVVIDDIRGKEPHSYEYWLNANGSININNNEVLISKNKANLKALMCYPNNLTSTYYEGFKTPDGNPIKDENGEIIEIPPMAKDSTDKRVMFKTDKVKDTKIVSVLNAYEDKSKNITYEDNKDYLKIVCDNYITYVNLKDTPVTTKEGYYFDGLSLTVKDNSYLLNQGKILKVNNEEVISSDKLVSVAVSTTDISISSIDNEANIRVNKNISSSYLLKNEKAIKLKGTYKDYGIEVNNNTVKVFPGEYHIYINDNLPPYHFNLKINSNTGGKVTKRIGDTALYKEELTFNVMPDQGYFVKDIKYNGKTVSLNGKNNFTIKDVTKDVVLDVTFDKINENISPKVITNNYLFTENENTSIAFFKVENIGFPMTEQGIIIGDNKDKLNLTNVNGKNIRKIPGFIDPSSCDFGVRIIDKNNFYNNKYYVRAYSIINNKEYLGNIVEYTPYENKDKYLKDILINGKSIDNFSEKTFDYYFDYLDNIKVTPILKSDNAGYTIKEYNFLRSGHMGKRVEIDVSSQGETKRYSLNFGKNLAFPVADTDVRINQYFKGDYSLIYADGINNAEAIIKFDIKNIKDFNNATLYISEIQAGNNLTNNKLYFHKAKDYIMWDENDLNYLKAPEKGELIDTYVTENINDYEEIRIDVTDYVKEALLKGKEYIDIIIKGTSQSWICSKERDEVSTKPIIILK